MVDLMARLLPNRHVIQEISKLLITLEIAKNKRQRDKENKELLLLSLSAKQRSRPRCGPVS